EINDAGTGADEVWSADKITTALGAYVLTATLVADYYDADAVDGLLAELAASEHTHTTIDNDLAINGALSVSGLLTAASANITAYLIAPTIRGNPGITFADGDGDGDGDGLIEIRNDGTLRSLAPEYSSTGDGGWEIGPDLQKFTNIHAAGSISASVYEYQQIHVGMGSQLYTKGGGGKLKAEITIDSASDAAIAMDIEDPEAGHIQLFSVGDVLR
ncbi:MAG: hypothetical protein KDJ36_19135, partial [Hyphomicrobiaceae bacterium]|nr:hypothetical protein [Hyphomicrobiaceae bacterium]